jgi:hypothetical protein
MRRSTVAFQVTGSLLAIFCALSIAIALGGCAAPEWNIQAPTVAISDDLLRSELRSFASLTGVTIPLSRTEEHAIIARAIAEHEMRSP